MAGGVPAARPGSGGQAAASGVRRSPRHAGTLPRGSQARRVTVPSVRRPGLRLRQRGAGRPAVPGDGVRQRALARRLLAVDPVHPVLALDVAAQAAAGLDAAHRIGLVHRDIKPGTILVGADGLVKITDFGIAHAAGSAPITGPGLVMGTTQYLAPERIAGGQATPASDLYALGILIYECLTGLPGRCTTRRPRGRHRAIRRPGRPRGRAAPPRPAPAARRRSVRAPARAATRPAARPPARPARRATPPDRPRRPRHRRPGRRCRCR